MSCVFVAPEYGWRCDCVPCCLVEMHLWRRCSRSPWCLRPGDVFYALESMGNSMQFMANELWQLINCKKWIKHVREALVERARKLVPDEMAEAPEGVVIDW